MITILSQGQTVAAEPPPPASPDAPFPDYEIAEAPIEGESEWVAGPRQLVAIAFVAIAGIALFSAISYLAGKASAHSEPLAPIHIALQSPATPSIGDQFATYAAASAPKVTDAPVFANPIPGKNYIQMAAVEKGVAAVFAEGLRAHGLPAFVAPGATPNIYRVVIGPVTDQQNYAADKAELDKIGLATFMRPF